MVMNSIKAGLLLAVAALVEVEEESLPDPCTTHRETLTPDGRGGKEKALVPFVSTNCRLTLRPVEEQIEGDAPRAGGDYTIALSLAIDLRETDVIETRGARYTVTGPVPSVSHQTIRRVLVKKL